MRTVKKEVVSEIHVWVAALESCLHWVPLGCFKLPFFFFFPLADITHNSCEATYVSRFIYQNVMVL